MYRYMNPLFMPGSTQSCCDNLQSNTATNDNPRKVCKKDKHDLREKIKEAIFDERYDELLYNSLICLALTQAEADLIAEIRDDEKRHVEQFRHLYKDLTGKSIEPPANPIVQVPFTDIAAFELGIKAEQEAIVSYNEMLPLLEKQKHKFVIVEIINDELKHLGQFNYLYAKHLNMYKR